MATVLLLHHALGRTPALERLAERLEEAGHHALLPDLFDGHVFASLEEGVGYADTTGFDVVRARGVAAAEGVPAPLVVVGFSLGALAAEELALTQRSVHTVVLVGSAVPPDVLVVGASWPDGVRLEVHGSEQDPWFVDEGDLEVAQALTGSVPGATLTLHPGSSHVLVEPGLDGYDAALADTFADRLVELANGADRA